MEEVVGPQVGRTCHPLREGCQNIGSVTRCIRSQLTSGQKVIHLQQETVHQHCHVVFPVPINTPAV